MARSEPPDESARGATTLLRSISEGVRTIVTVTERLNDLRSETAAIRDDLNRLAEAVYRIAGRLDGIDQRFSEIDKRIDLAVKLAVREEIERRQQDRRSD
jgi:predicted nuclease with TOPRIM domain